MSRFAARSRAHVDDLVSRIGIDNEATNYRRPILHLKSFQDTSYIRSRMRKHPDVHQVLEHVDRLNTPMDKRVVQSIH